MTTHVDTQLDNITQRLWSWIQTENGSFTLITLGLFAGEIAVGHLMNVDVGQLLVYQVVSTALVSLLVQIDPFIEEAEESEEM